MNKKQLRIPYFLIVGAMKAGTTTLAGLLNGHKRISIPNQEIHYFDQQRNYSRGYDWYLEQLISGHNSTDDRSLFGDKTPTYSYNPACPKRIYETIPSVKIIWIFRDPVKRAYSNYLHAYKQGVEILSFKSAVRREPERIKENIYKGYIERSKYSIQVERFLEYFQIDQMHFLTFEDLLTNQEVELERLRLFLEIEPYDIPARSSHLNATMMPFSASSLWLARKCFGAGSEMYRKIKRVNYRYPRRKPKLSESVRADLEPLFYEYNQKLNEITGLDLDAWKS